VPVVYGYIEDVTPDSKTASRDPASAVRMRSLVASRFLGFLRVRNVLLSREVSLNFLSRIARRDPGKDEHGFLMNRRTHHQRKGRP